MNHTANQLNLDLKLVKSQAKPRRATAFRILPTPAFVVKDGAVYLTLAGNVAAPMAGGGASGCVPGSPRDWKDMVK